MGYWYPGRLMTTSALNAYRGHIELASDASGLNPYEIYLNGYNIYDFNRIIFAIDDYDTLVVGYVNQESTSLRLSAISSGTTTTQNTALALCTIVDKGYLLNITNVSIETHTASGSHSAKIDKLYNVIAIYGVLS